MRVIVDATILCLRWHTKGGQQRYVRELLRHLGDAAPEDEFLVWCNFTRGANLPLYQELLRDLDRTRLRYRPVLCRVPPQILNGLRVPVDRLTGGGDALHVPVAAMRPTRRARRIVTIHDLAWFDHPECFAFADVARAKREVAELARRADLVLTVSEHARRTILERLGVGPDRVRAIYHGVSEILFDPARHASPEAVRARYGIREPYLLFVSTVQPNKNLVRLLEAFDLLRRGELKGWQLVIAGQRGWMADPIYARAEALGLGSDVVFTGFVEEQVLPTLYRQAALFVLPSLIEGFGIPVIEAMASGVPVVVSSGGALPEVVGDAGVIVDPYVTEEIARGILALAQDAALRQTLAARGRARAARFRWEETARQTAAAYRDVVGA